MGIRMGLIESVDDGKKIVNLIGYGEYIGVETRDFEGIPVQVGKVKLDSGKEVWADENAYFASAESIEATIADYKNKGYYILKK